MKVLTLCLVLASAAFAGERADYVSDASFVIDTYAPDHAQHSPRAMAAAGQAFLKTLDEDQRQQVTYPLDSPERREWTNLPAKPDAGGIRLGALQVVQVESLCDLMATLFSQQGYDKLRQIMLADDQLLRGGRARPGFGTENFSVVIFGTPSATEPWGFQLDGHHVGVNVSVQADRLTMSPSFIGTQPEAFEIGAQSYRPLAGEIDVAFDLANSLSDEQWQIAAIAPQRGRITTGPGTDGAVPEPVGVCCKEFNEEQKQLLLALVSQWVGDMPSPHSEIRLQQISADLDQTYFAWQGARERISDVSYRIQGPSVIIEYACQDLGGNPLDHLHTMYRDPTNEYGGQLDGAGHDQP